MNFILLRASTGFDGGFEAGEASREAVRYTPNLNINANDDLAFAA